MNVIPFPNFIGVEITGGMVRSATVTDQNGTRSVLTDVGRFLYLVNVLEADGSRISMWDGHSHAEAVKQANLLAIDYGGAVRDLTRGAQ